MPLDRARREISESCIGIIIGGHLAGLLLSLCELVFEPLPLSNSDGVLRVMMELHLICATSSYLHCLQPLLEREMSE
jgi:hypothetical protein